MKNLHGNGYGVMIPKDPSDEICMGDATMGARLHSA